MHASPQTVQKTQIRTPPFRIRPFEDCLENLNLVSSVLLYRIQIKNRSDIEASPKLNRGEIKANLGRNRSGQLRSRCNRSGISEIEVQSMGPKSNRSDFHRSGAEREPKRRQSKIEVRSDTISTRSGRSGVEFNRSWVGMLRSGI